LVPARAIGSAEFQDFHQGEAGVGDGLGDDAIERRVSGELPSEKPGVGGAQQGYKVERRCPVSPGGGCGGEIERGERRVLPSRHAKQEVVVEENGDVHVELCCMNEMQQPDHGSAVANHYHRLQVARLEHDLGQRHPRGKGGRAPMGCVDRVQEGEERVGQPHAANVGGERHRAWRQLQTLEGLAQMAHHRGVAATAAIGELGIGGEILILWHQASTARTAWMISPGAMSAPILLIPTTRLPSK
jgi:hypothetical protein